LTSNARTGETPLDASAARLRKRPPQNLNPSETIICKALIAFATCLRTHCTCNRLTVIRLIHRLTRFLRTTLIHDRDPLFTTEFRSMLADVGVEAVKLPPRSPNLNAYAERFVRSIKESCLDQMILFGETSLRKSIYNFVAHYKYAS